MAEEIKKTPGAEATPEAPQEKVESREEKLLTQEQVDKVVAERLKRAETQMEAKIKEAQAEAERLAKLSAEEKERELTAKYKEELDQKAKDVSIRENRLEAIEKFAEAKVPIELVSYVVRPDKDETLTEADKFIGTFTKLVAETVAEQLKGRAPKDISENSQAKETKVVRAF